MTKPDTDARISVIETRIDGISKDVHELTKVLKDVMARPQSIPFKEIITSIAATLAVVATLASFANSWVEQSNSVLRYRVQQAERKIEDIGMTVLRNATLPTPR